MGIYKNTIEKRVEVKKIEGESGKFENFEHFQGFSPPRSPQKNTVLEKKSNSEMSYLEF